MEIKKLSRFAVETSLNCERCFVLQYKYKISMPMLPFTLNIACDGLVKNEFDYYRKKQEPHPIFTKHGIEAVPFDHPEMDNWRHNFKGAYFIDEENGFKAGGAVDDLWLKNDGSLIVADTKTTAKNIFNWDETFEKYDYARGYQRQLEFYQYTYRQLGFEVADEAYILYYNGRKNEDYFNQQLTFDLHVIKLDCDAAWVKPAIIHARSLLDSDSLPEPSNTCDKCCYLKKRWQLSKKLSQEVSV